MTEEDGIELVDEALDEEEIEEDEDIESTLDDEVEDEVVEEIPPEEAVTEEVPEEEIIDERIYTVPLRKAYWTGSRLRRSNRAVRILREFVERHMKPEELLIQPEVNERIRERGIQKPPRKLKVRVTKNIDGLCVVYLA